MSFMNALNAGYSAEQVLEFLISSYPSLGRRIRNALNIGHDATSILKSFQNFDKNKLSALDQRARENLSSSNPITRGQEKTSQSSALGQYKQSIQALPQAALAAGGGYLAGRALQNVPQIAEQIGGAISGRGIPKTPRQTAEAPIAEAMGKTQEELSPDSTQTPSIIPSAPSKATTESIIEQMGLKDRIDNLLKNNPPEIIGPTIKSLLSPGQKTWLKQQTDQPIEEIVNEYIQQRPKQEESKAALQSQEIPQERLAILPDGQVGNLIEERQGIGSIELPNGQIRRQKLSEMDAEPPELAKQINDLISALPEEEKSRVLAFASYNPGQEFEFEGKKHNIPFMGVQFHNGDFYMYPGVSKEKFDKVVFKAVKAKTSGENEWGVWTQGDPSRGAGMHELIKELEKEFGKNFIKFKASEGYDFWKRFRKELKEYFLRRKGK